MHRVWIKRACIKSPSIACDGNPPVTHADFDNTVGNKTVPMFLYFVNIHSYLTRYNSEKCEKIT